MLIALVILGWACAAFWFGCCWRIVYYRREVATATIVTWQFNSGERLTAPVHSIDWLKLAGYSE